MRRLVGTGLLAAGLLGGVLFAQQAPKWSGLDAVELPALIVGAPPERRPVHGEQRTRELQRIAEQEHAMLRAYRGAAIDKFRHSFTSAGRDEFIFYNANTGEPLAVEQRFPGRPTYRERTVDSPDRESACRLMELGKPAGAFKRRLDATVRRLERSIGGDVHYHSGKRSDLDCFMPLTGHLLRTFDDIYMWNEVPQTGNIFSESAGNPLAVSSARARGLTQQLPGLQRSLQDLLLAHSIAYDWRDPFQNASFGSALLQVRAKIRESFTVAQSDYHTGVHNVNFVLLNGSERFSADSTFAPSGLSLYLAGIDPTVRTWRNEAVRDRYSMTFGPASEAYTALNAANESVYDSIMAALPQSDVHAYRMVRRFTLPELSDSTGIPLDSLRLFNFHTLQRNGYVYFGRRVEVEGLTEDTWWRQMSPQLQHVWEGWREESGPWSTQKSLMYADAFEHAGNLYLAAALRSSFGSVNTISSLEQYRRSPTRRRILAAFPAMPVPVLEAAR